MCFFNIIQLIGCLNRIQRGLILVHVEPILIVFQAIIPTVLALAFASVLAANWIKRKPCELPLNKEASGLSEVVISFLLSKFDALFSVEGRLKVL